MRWLGCLGGRVPLRASSSGYCDEFSLCTYIPDDDGPHYPATGEDDMKIPINPPSITGEENRQWIEGISKKINEEARPHRRHSGPPSIFRVPVQLQQNGGHTSSGHHFDKAYRPLMVHIGPYHQDLSEQPHFATVEAYKWQCLRALLSRHQDQVHASKQLNMCLQWLVKAEVQAAVRECYSEEIKLDAGELAQLLLVDACFIIHLLLENVNKLEIKASTNQNNANIRSFQHQGSPIIKNKVDEQETSIMEEDNMSRIDINDRKIQPLFVGGVWTSWLAIYDLLKLENQIPFFIIQTLYDNLKTPDDGENLCSLVVKLFSHIRLNQTNIIPRREKFYHLLHMFRESLVHGMSQKPKQQPKQRPKNAPEHIPNAMELQRAWIKIKRKKAVSSFFDITYKNTFFGGVVEIPMLQVYDYTDSIFRNLIAFEQCFPAIKPQNAYITLYCVLMDYIINTAEDVRLLNSEGILESGLPNQEAVADLFNNLCKEINYTIQGSYLEGLFYEVNNAYKSWWRKLYAALKRNYFANPWAFISFGAAVILLLLTVEQAVFTALSYYRQ